MTSQWPRHALVGWALTRLGAGTAGSAGAAGAGTPGEHAPTALLVFAAASLSEALEEVDRAFTARTGVRVNASYAASSLLAKQIEAGAPADAFFSADLAWVDYLEERGLLQRGSRREVLGNALVLIAPADSPLRLSITPGFDLAAALAAGRLAMADPDSVPAGQYARAALTKLGVWRGVSERLVRGENVRAALAYVARGEAPLGIVYRSDALAETRVRVVGVFPRIRRPPIVYALALTASARPEAARFADFLTSEAARQIFARYGFEPLSRQGDH